MSSAWLVAITLLSGAAIASSQTGVRRLPLRSRVEGFRGSGQWSEVRIDYPFDPTKSALIVCDMWDRHWCTGANLRVAELVKKLEPLLETARRNGITIVHAPSETMSFYANMLQRMRMLALPSVTPPKELDLNSPPLPIDDSDGGCDTPGETEHRAWTCEHPGLKIAPEDYISDNGREIYNLLRSRSIETVFYTGVHANMCILNRTFAIKQMMKWGVKCVLLRDLTDAMYNPASAPHVSHEAGTGLVVEYIESIGLPPRSLTICSTHSNEPGWASRSIPVRPGRSNQCGRLKEDGRRHLLAGSSISSGRSSHRCGPAFYVLFGRAWRSRFQRLRNCLFTDLLELADRRVGVSILFTVSIS